jgi:hypothetical protein
MKPLCKCSRRAVLQIGARSRLSGVRYASDASSVPIKHFPVPVRTAQHGVDIMHDPLWNKGLAFDMNERDRLGLRGLLPAALNTLESQSKRVLQQIEEQPDNESKNMYVPCNMTVSCPKVTNSSFYSRVLKAFSRRCNVMIQRSDAERYVRLLVI